MMPAMKQPTAVGMPMPMPPMGAMPMMAPMPMMMPMMAASPKMACKMRSEMTPDGVLCTLMPMEPVSMDMLEESCLAIMQSMMACGKPMMMSCNGMPFMICLAEGVSVVGSMPMMGMLPMLCSMKSELTRDGLSCSMRPMAGIGMDMMKNYRDMMMAMLKCNLSMMMNCGDMSIVLSAA